MHKEQFSFVAGVAHQYPEFFTGVSVVEFGSLDINGSVRRFFANCKYVGVDIGEGRGVDVVCRAADYKTDPVDTVISCEMLEHDEQWRDSLLHMVEILRPGGLMIVTCATDGRAEHGTRRTSPGDAPFCGDYYRNINVADLLSVLPLDDLFSVFVIKKRIKFPADLYFYGLKKEQ